MHHHTISAEVDPAFIGIDSDVHRTSADVTAAVEFVPLGTGELEHVDVFFFNHVLHDRAVLNHVGLEVFEVRDMFLDVLHELQARVVGVHV